ncbi:MAG: hypothetical protein KBS98_06210 [Flavobacterium sp.]|nr:hypothetical protein [Candidatus Neoflavobacterium equi]
MEEPINELILKFFEDIPNYYGCKTEITSGIYSTAEFFSASNTTWNLLELQLLRSAYRKEGARLMIEGQTMYYEIAASCIIDFKHTGRHYYEFVEKYGENTYRITKLRFHSKY